MLDSKQQHRSMQQVFLMDEQAPAKKIMYSIQLFALVKLYSLKVIDIKNATVQLR
jgi:hypothetical protein